MCTIHIFHTVHVWYTPYTYSMCHICISVHYIPYTYSTYHKHMVRTICIRYVHICVWYVSYAYGMIFVPYMYSYTIRIFVSLVLYSQEQRTWGAESLHFERGGQSPSTFTVFNILLLLIRINNT